ncbi:MULTISPECIES: hypothetical protein [Kribbella]|uniref:hypothetical protein n=1 Tax=Kribbella TaxID=182639 RepID=UPI0018EE8BA0|nr:MULTISPECIES: hypothetical protein [Kribbella]
MGVAQALLGRGSGVRLDVAAATFLGTITVPKPAARTPPGSTAWSASSVADADLQLLGVDPDRVAGWFVATWDDSAPSTFNARSGSGLGRCPRPGLGP